MNNTKSLQDEIEAARQEYVKRMRVSELSLKEFLSYTETGNRLTYEEQYFARRRELAVLSLSLLQDTDEQTENLLEQTLWEICNEYTWALPAHLPLIENRYGTASPVWLDLFAAETGQALIETIELIGQKLSPFLKERIFQEVERRILLPFESRPWDWEEKENNWSAVIGGCIGMIALSMLSMGSQRQRTIIQRLDKSMQSYLRGFGADGACVEGVSYWGYGFGYFIYYAKMLEDKLSDSRYLANKKVKNIAAFPYSVMINEKGYVPFSDYAQPDLPSGLLSFCHEYFQVSIPKIEAASSLEFDACYRFAQLYRNLSWTKPMNKQVAKPEGKKYFEDAQWLILRSEKEDFEFAAKGGRNDESHNHLDIGHFIVGNGKELFLTDLGAGEYTKDYFNEKMRYDFFVPSALSHSLPIINGYSQLPGKVGAESVCCHQEGAEFHFQLSLGSIYPTEAFVKTFIRHFRVDPKKRKVKITDQFTFLKEKNKIVETFISKIKPELENKRVKLIGEKKCELSVDAGTVTIVEKSYPNHEGKIEKAYLIQNEVQAKQQIECLTMIQLTE